MTIERESIDFDMLFVGGGPAGLAGAIRFMQICREKNIEPEAALIDKGAEIGSHALSGAVLNPVALKELIPDYEKKGCPIEAVVQNDEFYFLTPQKKVRVPVIPKHMHNKGYLIVSLSKFVKWLSDIAEEMGVAIFPGFSGKEVLFDKDGKTIIGVRTGDKGIGKDGTPKSNFEPGLDLFAKVTVFAEGARGNLVKQISDTLPDFDGDIPQVYETGIKEVIQLPEDNYFKHSRGNDIHTLGYPIGLNVPGGGFIYEMKDNRIAIGYLIGLSYENPLLDIYEEFMKFKSHPFIADIIKGGKVIEQGARTVSTGGYFSIPNLVEGGAMFAGGCAAMQNVPALKGIHVSMKSGMLAAEAAVTALEKNDFSKKSLDEYTRLFHDSWLKEEIYEGRNFSQALSKKGIIKFIYLGTQYFSDGSGLRDNMYQKADWSQMLPVSSISGETTLECEKQKVHIKKIDGVLYVDRLTGVYLSKTNHREDEPSHLIIHDRDICITHCYPKYKSPCTRFCPGQVYEIEADEEATGSARLKINPSNCLHCKTCDVKDPYKNITWTCPEGGGGPGYTVV